MNNTNYWIKIFPQLTKELVNNNLVKEYIFFGTLKKIHSSHFNYKKLKGISRLSSYMGCSHATTRRMINRLFDLGWVTEDKNGKDLRFVSNKKLFAQFGLEEKQFGYNARYVGKATSDIITLSIAVKNVGQQQYQLNEKFSTVGKILPKVYKANKAAALFVLHNERNVKNFSVNHDIVLTRAGISRMTNKSSVSSGKNQVKRWDEMGAIDKDKNRIVKLSDNGDRNCLNVLDSSCYINCKGELWMQLPNELVLASVSEINNNVGMLLSKVKKGANVSFKYNASFKENMLELFANMDQRSKEYIFYSQRDFSLSRSIKGLDILKKNNPLVDIYLSKSLANKN